MTEKKKGSPWDRENPVSPEEAKADTKQKPGQRQERLTVHQIELTSVGPCGATDAAHRMASKIGHCLTALTADGGGNKATIKEALFILAGAILGEEPDTEGKHRLILERHYQDHRDDPHDRKMPGDLRDIFDRIKDTGTKH